MDDYDMGDMWRSVKAAGQAKRADNRKSSPQLLAEAGIAFTAKNDGAHLIVGGFDFWPGTGLFMPRGGGKRRYGVRNLIKAVRATHASTASSTPAPALPGDAAPVELVPDAWQHDDGRVIGGASKAGLVTDGGASKSSVAGYTEPLFSLATLEGAGLAVSVKAGE